MNRSEQRTIAVFGGTGRQGGSVARYLKEHGSFTVRVITRNPEGWQGIADEVVYGDLTKPETLDGALAGAYGVFLVTNYWSGATPEDWAQTPVGEWADPVDEFAQGKAAVEAALRSGVKHLIWSTLPDTTRISNGAYNLPFWTGKARLDEVIAAAGFDHHSFVEAPFYYQNFLKEVAPTPQSDGTSAWYLPMRPDSRVMHMADIDQIGSIVLGAFLNPEVVGQGQHLSLSAGTYSWADVVRIFRALGHDVVFNQVEDSVFDGLFPGAKSVRESQQYMESHTYFGPDADRKITLARSIATEPLVSLEQWLKANMPS